MINTCTGSQEVHQLWQTGAIFEHKKQCASSFSTIPFSGDQRLKKKVAGLKLSS